MYEIRLAPCALQNIWLPTEAEPAKIRSYYYCYF